MKFELHLEENETSEDINTLSITNALLNFLDIHNSHVIKKPVQEACSIIFKQDIADIIYILYNSTNKYMNKLKEQDNERV